MKTISDKIFELLKERGMTQKEFSEATGIAASTISEWKRNRTNPVSDKILMICDVLEVTPYELLSGAEHIGERSRESESVVFSKNTEIGTLVDNYMKLSKEKQERVQGYIDALLNI